VGPLVVHCWTDLQSVHGFRCYDNSAECKVSASDCTRSMPGSLRGCYLKINGNTNDKVHIFYELR